jgi:hypothetical protein
VIVGSLSSVEHPIYADHKAYSVSVSQPGVLSASVQWVGEGDLWLFIFDAEPPTNHPPLASTLTPRSAPISARVTAAGIYFVMVSQSQVDAGPDKGACGCVDNFTLTVTYP